MTFKIKDYLNIIRHRGFKNFYHELKDYFKFDLFLGLETQDRILNNKSYVPSYFDFFKKAIQSSKINLKKTVLVDLGAGKGRVVIGAYLMGFAKVIAIEKDRQIFTTLKKNTKKISKGKIIIINDDANKFNVKKYLNNRYNTLIFYAYHPFNFDKILNILEKNFRIKKIKKYFIYFGFEKNIIKNKKLKYTLLFENKYSDKTRVLRVYKNE